ncbi:hypothetical protein LOY46_07390 [Pseudomonas sichuanensis]|uniref:hypothetical protein n=1 Tax=Pseudomonas sichuanensis TaxID=2213015 RepID=UPI0021609142|nr:hypothetical protein [Pseudomonas sichuanensis]UVK84515.1 hypothetical protein LOY46_07390 [Pseudomonas sichuanensis]
MISIISAERLKRHLPIFVILAIYLPAACLGHYLFRDESSRDFLILLILFSLSYGISFPYFSRLYLSMARRAAVLRDVSSSFWEALACGCLLIYLMTLVYVSWRAPSVPLLVALNGGSLMDIAHSRSQFLAGLTGFESLLRYAVFILGRSIIPLILVAAFMAGARARFALLGVVLVLSLLSMEKAAPIFVLLPLVLHYAFAKSWRASVCVLLLLLGSILLMSFLAMGGNSSPAAAGTGAAVASSEDADMRLPAGTLITEPIAPPERSLLPYYLHVKYGAGQYRFDPATVAGKSTLLLNRIVWVPYVTAYNWLEFQRIVLQGHNTYGRSISLVHLLYGEPKMNLEKMVYVFEYGASPGGEGGSNTVFFVDAKLAFGWLGAIAYSLLFTFCAACILTSGRRELIVASIVCLLVASVSSLTATLLSGGLFIYVVLSLLTGTPSNRSIAGQETAR